MCQWKLCWSSCFKWRRECSTLRTKKSYIEILPHGTSCLSLSTLLRSVTPTCLGPWKMAAIIIRWECHDDNIKWKHLSALLAICAGNSPVTGELLAQRPVTPSFDVFFDLRLINGWINNREAGGLRRHRAHYDIIVMCFFYGVISAAISIYSTGTSAWHASPNWHQIGTSELVTTATHADPPDNIDQWIRRWCYSYNREVYYFVFCGWQGSIFQPIMI